FFSSRRRHTRFSRDWSSDVCSSDLVAAAREKHAAIQAAKLQAAAPVVQALPQATPLVDAHTSTQPAMRLGAMSFNKEQQLAIEMAMQAKSFCLIGAAGTGKTTVTQEIITRL